MSITSQVDSVSSHSLSSVPSKSVSNTTGNTGRLMIEERKRQSEMFFAKALTCNV